ncbi:DNA polymerase catalytic subunit [Anguillid herpesvirus 1]|uniref:DNA-directed DNA polymerase n=1 Tax=Anguillid herpesvirus 1 TaxID=150286 RepID=A0A1J0REZ3_9VIRU|nr:DNA polymerase catalytic subunit [Anguillid herpesvirus 1]QRM16477.1 DNA polymerase catalytic subunit [Anguillid herpesvirus 1]QRM16740.1 DNA polymerase catalytic subunit [Anguillid herpesvirus 1]
MDFKYYAVFADRLVQQKCATDAQDGDIFYTVSIRAVEDRLRVVGCFPDTCETACLWIEPIYCPLVLDKAYSAYLESKPQLMALVSCTASTLPGPERVNLVLNNGDTKEDVSVTMYLFEKKADRKRVADHLRQALPAVPDMGTFDSLTNNMGGAADCIYNRVYCCNFYRLKRDKIRATDVGSNGADLSGTIKLRDLTFDEDLDRTLYNDHFFSRDEAVLKQNHILYHTDRQAYERKKVAGELAVGKPNPSSGIGRRVPELVYRCGHFDFETVFDEQNLDPKLHPEKDETFAEDKAIKDRIKKCGLVGSFLPAPRASKLRGYKEVISVSLVYRTDTCALFRQGKKGQKMRRVWYNASRVDGVGAEPRHAPYVKGSHEDCVTDCEIIACDSELDLLVRFLAEVAQYVDVLFVYNYDFDVAVLHSRLNFYQTVWPSLPLTRKLTEMYDSVFSCDPKNVPPHFYFSDQRYNSMYCDLLDVVEKHMDAFKALCRTRISQNRAAQRKVQQGLFDSVSSPAGTSGDDIVTKRLMYDYPPYRTAIRNHNDQVILNSTVHGFGKYVIDLMKLNNTRSMKHIARGFSKLEVVARAIIGDARPYKNPFKMGKIQGVKYTEMDGIFKRGGAGLTRLLYYNLVDSELLARIVRYAAPHIEFISRLRATLNVDYVCHGRGTMDFSGAMVQSTKSVEAPLLRAKLKENRFFAAGRAFASMCLTEKYASAQSRKTLTLKGGKVFQPTIGLTYTGPYVGTVCTYDFASLYPSNMCDANISPESIVSRDPSCRAFVVNKVVLDWKRMPAISGLIENREYGEAENLYTILLHKSVETGWTRFTTYTSSSLRHYLSMRNKYKGDMKTAKSPGLKKYFNQLQNEMKICANSHYGVSDRICQMLTTLSGRQKILIVEDVIKKTPGMTVIYGDTDSIMFQVPPSDREVMNTNTFKPISVETVETVETVDAERITHYTKLKTEIEGETVHAVLKQLNVEIYDYMAARMIHFDQDGKQTMMQHETDPKTGEKAWFFEDEDGSGGRRKHYLRDLLDNSLITNLAYENTATVTMNLTKKMYVYTNHELDEGVLTNTKEKMRGVQAVKSSAAGATKDFNTDIISVIFKGWALRKNKEFMSLRNLYQAVPWFKVNRGDLILVVPDNPVFDDHQACTNYDVLKTEWCEVLDIKRTAPKDKRHYVIHQLTLRQLTKKSGGDAKKFQYTCATDANHFNMTHTFSLTEQIRRNVLAVEAAKYRYWSVSAGFTDWRSLVAYSGLNMLKNPELERKFQRMNAHNLKNNKVAYVSVDPLTSGLANAGKDVKQVPYEAFLVGMMFDVKPDILDRDMWGESHIRMAGFEPEQLFEALAFPELVRECERDNQDECEESEAEDEDPDCSSGRICGEPRAGPIQNRLLKDRAIGRLHPTGLKHALSLCLCTSETNYGTHILLDSICPKINHTPYGWPLHDRLRQGMAYIKATFDATQAFKKRGQILFRKFHRTPVRTGPLYGLSLDRADMTQPTLLEEDWRDVPLLNLYERNKDEGERGAFLLEDLLTLHAKLVKDLAPSGEKRSDPSISLPAYLALFFPESYRLVPLPSDPIDPDMIRCCEALYTFTVLLGYAKARYPLSVFDRMIDRLYLDEDRSVAWQDGALRLGPPPKHCTKKELVAFFKIVFNALGAAGPMAADRLYHCDVCRMFWEQNMFSVQRPNISTFLSTHYISVDKRPGLFQRNKELVCLGEARTVLYQ